MTDLEKKIAKATRETIVKEIAEYASEDDLAAQIIKRVKTDKRFKRFFVLTIQAITIDGLLEDENDD